MTCQIHSMIMINAMDLTIGTLKLIIDRYSPKDQSSITDIETTNVT